QESKIIMSSIEERVAKIIIEQLGVKPEDVKPEASFVEDLGADSLDTVELVMALEEEFETEIPDEEAEKISTVQSAVDYIKAHASCALAVPLENAADSCSLRLFCLWGLFGQDGHFVSARNRVAVTGLSRLCHPMD